MVPYYSMKIFHKFFWSRAIGPGHHGVSLKAKLMRRKIQYDVLPERYLYSWYCLQHKHVLLWEINIHVNSCGACIHWFFKTLLKQCQKLSFGHFFSANIILLMSFIYLFTYCFNWCYSHLKVILHICTYAHTLSLAPLNSSVSTFNSIGQVVSGQGCHSESSEVDPSPLDVGADFLNFISFIYFCFMYFN